MNIKEIIAQHPVPWAHHQTQPGLVVTFDAKGTQVQLFTLLDFVTAATLAMVKPTESTSD